MVAAASGGRAGPDQAGMTIGRSVGPIAHGKAGDRPWQIIQRAIHVGLKGGKKGGREEEPFHHGLQASERRIGSATAAVARCAAFRVGTFVALFTAA